MPGLSAFGGAGPGMVKASGQRPLLARPSWALDHLAWGGSLQVAMEWPAPWWKLLLEGGPEASPLPGRRATVCWRFTASWKKNRWPPRHQLPPSPFADPKIVLWGKTCSRGNPEQKERGRNQTEFWWCNIRVDSTYPLSWTFSFKYACVFKCLKHYLK